MSKRAPFPLDIKKKVLLWSDRHCCLCGKSCGTDIEIAHIDNRSDNSLDNAMPLCYDCHAAIGRYNDEHPKGNKYKPEELKIRREQIFERYTIHLVPPIHIELVEIANLDTDKPRVGTRIVHQSNQNPVNLTLKLDAYVGKEKMDTIKNQFYSGEIVWNLNPRTIVGGSFGIEKDWIESGEKFRIELNPTIIDIYERAHPLLPFCYTYVGKERNTWSYDPAPFSELVKVMK